MKISLILFLSLIICAKSSGQQMIRPYAVDAIAVDTIPYQSYYIKNVDSIPNSYLPADLLNCGSKTVGDTVFEYSHWGAVLDHIRREEDYWRKSKAEERDYYFMYWIGVDEGIRHIMYAEARRDFDFKFRTK